MRIIHTSDIHLGSKITAHLDAARAQTRRRELQDGFARLVRKAKELSAKAIIIAGDLFDEDTVSKRLIEATLATVDSASEIMFLYLPGNHEGEALSASGIPLPKNLKIFGEDWTSFELDGVTVTGRTRLSRDMFKSLRHVLSDERKNRTIAVLHGELQVGASSEKVIGAKDLEGTDIDYIALGHYHSYSVKNIGKTQAVYCGTPEGRGFDEAGERGFVVIDVSEDGVTHTFVPSEGRKLRIIETDITGEKTQSEIEAAVGRALLGVSKNDMVRVVLVGNHAPDTVRDTDSIRRRFSHEYFYFEAKDKTTLGIRAEDYKHDKSLMGEFVRQVMADEKLTPQERGRILEYGIHALRGESMAGR